MNGRINETLTAGNHAICSKSMMLACSGGRTEPPRIAIIRPAAPNFASSPIPFKAMHQLVEGEINIEYMYAFANGIDAAAVLKSDEPGRVVDILTGCGFTVYSADEAYSANV